MVKTYNVRGLLRKDNKAKQFSIKVNARSARSAEKDVKKLVEGYCMIHYPDQEEVKCIINKKTVRCK